MLNKLPFLGWIFSTIAAMSMAVPFWLCWTVGGIGQTFFQTVLPAVFLAIGFWQTVGLFIVINILGALVQYLTPKFVSVAANTSNNQNG
jgi:hypothetical protein